MPSLVDSFALIEEIRKEIRAFGYEPLDDRELAEMHAAVEDAVKDGESAGVHRTPRLAALHEMLIEERAPPDVRDIAVHRFMEAIAATARPADADRDDR